MNPITFTKPFFSENTRLEITNAINKILISGKLMQGEYTSNLESSFASYIGTTKAISTNTCTTALQICLMHYDVRGCEVLVPTASFFTDVSVVRWAGGIPILVDADPLTLSFDMEDLKRKVTSRTKGIIWVHLTGVISPNWREIVAFSKENNLFLIEDCAHAHGATVDGMKAGAIGDVGCFSFYPTKVMTTGTGGILTTNDNELANAAIELRNFGREKGIGSVVREGNDWFLDEIRASIGYYQLQDLENQLLRRRAIAERYNQKLVGLKGVRFLVIPHGNSPSYYHYTVFVDQSLNYAELTKKLKEKYSIPTKPIYVPLHQEQIFLDLDNGTLHKSEDALNRSLCLPLFVEMTNEQVDYVADALIKEIKAVYE